MSRTASRWPARDGAGIAGVFPLVTLGLVAILACASAGGPAQPWHPSASDSEYERVDTLAKDWATFEEFDRNLSSLRGDFENFDEATRLELTILRDQLVEMQEHLRQLLDELELARAERWSSLEEEIDQTIEEMDGIFDRINSLLGPNDISDTLA